MVAVKEFPRSHGRPACKYLSCSSSGVQLCVEEGVLVAVHMFASHKQHGCYEGCLPAGLSFELSGRQCVEKLGEPTQKGGGRTEHIWVEYELEMEKWCLQLEFESKRWDDPEGKLVAVTVSGLST